VSGTSMASIIPSRVILVAMGLVIVSTAACGSPDSSIRAAGPPTTAPPECAETLADSPYSMETTSDFVDQADVVALVELGASAALPGVKLQDYVSERLVATATVLEAVKGAVPGSTVKIFHAVRSVDPTNRARGAHLQGTEGHRFEEGDRLVVALGPANAKGEREPQTVDAFFVDRNGRLDPKLGATRARCAKEPVPLFDQTRGMTTEELLAALAAEV
jgi:hypothetical protein